MLVTRNAPSFLEFSAIWKESYQYVFRGKVRIIREISKENFKVIDTEDAAVAYLAAFTGGKQLDVAPTSVKVVSRGDTIRSSCIEPLDSIWKYRRWSPQVAQPRVFEVPPPSFPDGFLCSPEHSKMSFQPLKMI